MKQETSTDSKILDKQDIKYLDSIEEIESLIKGRVPIIWVQTFEEDRFIAEYQNGCGKHMIYSDEWFKVQ